MKRIEDNRLGHHRHLPAALVSGNGQVLLGAHRGARSEARENTLEAFRVAIERGADFIGFDVRRTRDDVLVVHHDAAVARYQIAEMSYGELEANPRTRHVPTLEQVLQLVVGHIRLDVELKEAGYEAQVLVLLKQYLKPDQFVITSFQTTTVVAVKHLAPEVGVGLLVGGLEWRQQGRWQLGLLFQPAKTARLLGADFLACRYSLADRGLIAAAARQGLPVVIWIVNDGARLQRYLRDYRVQAVITDKIAWALNVRQYTVGDGLKNPGKNGLKR